MHATHPLRLFLPACLIGLYALTAGCSGSASSREAREPDTITAEDIERTGPATELSDLIEGRIPGVSVVRSANGQVRIRARGVSSFGGNDDVLVVVDDLPVMLDPDGSIPGVVITEIASIKMLRDLTETSRYGMRGQNGVIVVATKQGKTRK